ncbi:hypothetical protein MKY14_04490 [Paenibacillus sp. FSL R5-0887]|nr:hypothetical protein [Paenibacillus odorifer]
MQKHMGPDGVCIVLKYIDPDRVCIVQKHVDLILRGSFYEINDVQSFIP